MIIKSIILLSVANIAFGLVFPPEFENYFHVFKVSNYAAESPAMKNFNKCVKDADDWNIGEGGTHGRCNRDICKGTIGSQAACNECHRGSMKGFMDRVYNCAINIRSAAPCPEVNNILNSNAHNDYNHMYNRCGGDIVCMRYSFGKWSDPVIKSIQQKCAICVPERSKHNSYWRSEVNGMLNACGSSQSCKDAINNYVVPGRINDEKKCYDDCLADPNHKWDDVKCKLQ